MTTRTRYAVEDQIEGGLLPVEIQRVSGSTVDVVYGPGRLEGVGDQLHFGDLLTVPLCPRCGADIVRVNGRVRCASYVSQAWCGRDVDAEDTEAYAIREVTF